jgi:hypothetical protein
MSLTKIRAALEVGLNGMSPALATAWESVAYTPVTGTPYQRVSLLPATPDNPSIGAALARQTGIFQVTLMYPPNAGTQEATARAEAICTYFARGTSWTKDGVVVHIDSTPAIGPAMPDGDRLALPVSIRYRADIFS